MFNFSSLELPVNIIISLTFFTIEKHLRGGKWKLKTSFFIWHLGNIQIHTYSLT